MLHIYDICIEFVQTPSEIEDNQYRRLDFVQKESVDHAHRGF